MANRHYNPTKYIKKSPEEMISLRTAIRKLVIETPDTIDRRDLNVTISRKFGVSYSCAENETKKVRKEIQEALAVTM